MVDQIPYLSQHFSPSLARQVLGIFSFKGAGSPAILKFAQPNAAQSMTVLLGNVLETTVHVTHLAMSSTRLVVHPFVLKYTHSLNLFFQMLQKQMLNQYTRHCRRYYTSRNISQTSFFRSLKQYSRHKSTNV